MSQGLIQGLQSQQPANASRRSFLKFSALLSATAAGGLLLGIQWAEANSETVSKHDAMRQPYPEQQPNTVFSPNAFIEINPAGDVALIMSKVEMGQGIYTAISMLIAEELSVDLEKVTLQHAPPNDKLYGDAMLGAQVTGGSTSVRTLWQPMREAGAVCRTLLVSAAANQWGVDPETCKAEDGAVIHIPSNKQLGYGALASAAANLPIPKSVTLKPPAEFTLIGKPIHRLDTPDKVNGMAKFGMDNQLPDMHYAIVASCPVFGGKLVSVDDTRALNTPDVIKVLTLDNAVAVVAKHTWAAKRGLDALDIVWDEGKNKHLNTEDLINDLKKAANKKDGAIATNHGNYKKAVTNASQVFEAEYEQPFLAHATMEPMNCTVHVTEQGCSLWVGTQVPTFAQKTAAAVLGIPPEKVTLHNFLIGGGFGRRLETDTVKLAVSFAKQMPVPIKFIWTREEDIQHDMYRPYYYDVIKAGIDDKGFPVAWSHRIVGSSIMARFAPGSVKNGVDSDAVEVAAEPPYELPNLYVDYVRQEPRDLPTAFWRGVGATRGTFVVESFIDELAHLAKQDPIDYRLHLLEKTPRLKSALQTLASKAKKENLADGEGQGVSAMHAFGSYLAMMVDITVNQNHEVKVNKVTCIVDCGMVVNPNTVKAQIEGGIIFGITAILHDEITLEHGRVMQNNFNDYRMMRINEAPIIETHIVQSAESPGGIGEPGTAAVGAALVNAIFSATGKRIRKLPVGNQLQTMAHSTKG